MSERTITQPDDWHVHLRDGAALSAVVAYTARQFARALVMPNLDPPLTSASQALAYRRRILDACPAGSHFEPLMSLYLTPDTHPDTIAEAAGRGVIAAKLYPAGVTTGSAVGVRDLKALYTVFDAMQTHDMVLCIHGEVVDPEIDVFDREAVFIERHLAGIVESFPRLRVVLEHVTTAQGVVFVKEAREGIAATITAHHLLYNRNVLLAGGIRPHYYCAPILKAEKHRQALVGAAISSSPRFFLGTDSAPHARGRKESACGCAGVFTAHAALEFYAAVFEAHGVLDRLEAFAAHRGADFYGLPRNSGTVTLRRAEWEVPEQLPYGDEVLVPMGAGEKLRWRVA